MKQAKTGEPLPFAMAPPAGINTCNQNKGLGPCVRNACGAKLAAKKPPGFLDRFPILRAELSQPLELLPVTLWRDAIPGDNIGGLGEVVDWRCHALFAVRWLCLLPGRWG